MKLIHIMVYAACVAVLTASIASSEVGEYPHAPMVHISEVDKNWIRIETARESKFDINNPEHMNQVHSLGEYGCALFNRIGVVLSQSKENVDEDVLKIMGLYPVFYFLIACALP